MKLLRQLLILVLMGIALYVIRDDLVSTINNIAERLNKNKNSEQVVSYIEKKENQILSKIDTPGALRVPDSIVLQKKIDLTKAQVIEITNERRKDNGGLAALKENLRLDVSAEKKLEDMFAKQYFEHLSPDNVGVKDLAKNAGYEYILIGENLAMGDFNNDSALLDAWMASPGHRENILNKYYTEIGVAVGKGNFEGKEIWMAVQHFGTPRSVCPTIDQVLLGNIDLDKTKISKMESDLSDRKDAIEKGVIYEGSTYREQVEQYNALVISYNNLLKDVEKEITTYNDEVREFNLCVTALQ